MHFQLHREGQQRIPPHIKTTQQTLNTEQNYAREFTEDQQNFWSPNFTGAHLSRDHVTHRHYERTFLNNHRKQNNTSHNKNNAKCANYACSGTNPLTDWTWKAARCHWVSDYQYFDSCQRRSVLLNIANPHNANTPNQRLKKHISENVVGRSGGIVGVMCLSYVDYM